MKHIRRWLYRRGHRPPLGSIWHSPSLHLIYAMKDADFANVLRRAFNKENE